MLFEPDALWQKLWQDDTGLRVIIYTVIENRRDWWSLVLLFSLDFGGVDFNDFELGGRAEESEIVSVIEHQCERLD